MEHLYWPLLAFVSGVMITFAIMSGREITFKKKVQSVVGDLQEKLALMGHREQEKLNYIETYLVIPAMHALIKKVAKLQHQNSMVIPKDQALIFLDYMLVAWSIKGYDQSMLGRYYQTLPEIASDYGVKGMYFTWHEYLEGTRCVVRVKTGWDGLATPFVKHANFKASE